MNELKLDPRRTAVVVIELQKRIVSMAAGAPHPASSVVANCVHLLTTGRNTGAHTVLVHVGGSPIGADLLHPVKDEPMRGIAALPPDWSDLLPELGSSPSDTVILKWQWSEQGESRGGDDLPSHKATTSIDCTAIRPFVSCLRAGPKIPHFQSGLPITFPRPDA